MEKIRQRTGSFLKSHGISEDIVHAQFRVIRELIKTGIKYGNFPQADTDIKINIQVDENTITIETKNPINETAFERLKELEQTIQFIRGYQDPFEAYMLKRKEASKNSSYEVTNALGLARIAYEENAILDFFISKDNDLFLSAVSSLEADSWN